MVTGTLVAASNRDSSSQVENLYPSQTSGYRCLNKGSTKGPKSDIDLQTDTDLWTARNRPMDRQTHTYG